MAKKNKDISYKITWDDKELRTKIRAYPLVIDRAVGAAMDYWSGPIESSMKVNARWTDQTSNARNGLAARHVRDGKEHAIVAFHQVPYGIWLETRWSGRYAIIMPTIQEFAPKVMDTIRKMVK